MIQAALMSLCIIGTWQYAGFLYEGHDYPIPNENLVLQFRFQEDGVVNLKYYRKNEPGICERTAEYSVKDDVLYQKITWVNPENKPECGQDSDMQNGRESYTTFQCNGAKMAFKLDLNGKEFDYKMDRVISP